MAGDVALDTIAAVAHLRGVAAATARMQELLATGHTLFLPLPAWGEMLYGAHRSGHLRRELGRLETFALTTTLLVPTSETAWCYARCKHLLAEAGTPLPENDIWIAAMAIEHGLPLATRDAHFRQIPELKVLEWR